MTLGREIPHYKVSKRFYLRKKVLDSCINKGKVKTNEEINSEIDE